MSRAAGAAAFLGLCALLACGGMPAGTASGTAAGTPTAPSPSPPPPARFTVVLPVAADDAANDVFGLNPFGIHFGGTGPGGHGLDGHPGWDVEYRVGASIRAAADGTVQSVFADSHTAGRFTVQIQHQAATGNYRTVYTNVTAVANAVAAGASVVRGQPIGTAGAQSQVVGTRQQTWAMTHFQVDDFSRAEGSTNPNAVNPEELLDAAGRDLFEAVWRSSAWAVELTEPFSGNPRDVTFPVRRTWTRESGAQLSARLDFIRADAASGAHTYELSNEAGAVVERGRVAFTPAQAASTIDLRSDAGDTRAGVIDIVGDTMRIAVGAPGAARPGSLNGASVYRTTR